MNHYGKIKHTSRSFSKITFEVIDWLSKKIVSFRIIFLLEPVIKQLGASVELLLVTALSLQQNITYLNTLLVV